MKQKLFLTSEGIQPSLREVFLSLLVKPAIDNKVLLITTAAYGESDDVSWLENHRKLLRDCGIKQIQDLDLRFTDKQEIEKLLGQSDIVFVAGGNTCFLLKYVRESGFSELIGEFIENGGLYVGNSAGSYIVCPTIEQAFWNGKFTDKNRVKLTNFESLNLVPFWIFAHFTEKWRQDIETAAKKTKFPIIVLNDKQAVLVEGDKWKIVGEGEKIIFNFD